MARRVLTLALLWVVAALPLAAQTEERIQPDQQAPSGSCSRTLVADIAAIDQPYFWNRLGAIQPHGMLYALKRDIVALNGGSSPSAGNAMLREEKRPRPLVLRMNVGDCLRIRLTNWLHPVVGDNEQVRTRDASARVTGLSLVETIASDGSWVGVNPGAKGSLALPGQTRNYVYYAEKEGTYLLYNGGALTGGEGDNGTISAGLFGAVNVEPKGSVWYRSQVTQVDFDRTVTGYNPLERSDEELGVTWTEQYPQINYNANHPSTHPSRPNLPVLKMLAGNQILYSDLTAIIVPPAGAYPLAPAVYPDRDAPFREFTIIFHDEPAAVQAFPHFYDEHDNVGVEPEDGLAYTLHSVRDAFAINYGTGGIGAEILANRLGVGPMHRCINCRYEEFFLSAWVVGDPAMVVDVPANAPCDMSSFHDDGKPAPIEGEPGYCNPTRGPKATVALYPDDPSNVYHSYLNDHTKFRNLLVGSDDHHIFHLHAHQWLHTPDGDNSTYKDSQAIGQGTAFTYEIAFDGSGNRNKTVGDSIFHCHFYPHFAQGMWGMWRVHDVLETGTPVDGKGRPVPGTRALPDGEIARGTPIPGLVPLPGQPMAPPPSVQVSIVNGQVDIALNQGNYAGNPGYPFYVPGVAGQRVPTPPLDVYWDPVNNMFHDGGLPRHVVVDGAFTQIQSRLDFSKDLIKARAIELADDGEPWEQAAMRWHADQIDDTVDGAMKVLRPDGTSGSFRINGSKPIEGAPYADPCGEFVIDPDYPPYDRQYKAANIQMDVAFNSEGWHFPQQRFLSLWGDVHAYLNQGKDPEPLFIRANSGDCVTYLHTNLVPKYYELDDFQVRTPTDILGQHIHLVKFDVTSSDGSANGFNYEDGTLSPEEVRAMIAAINVDGGIYDGNGNQHLLTAVHHPYFVNVPNADSLGAQTTVQRWYVDPILNNLDENRSLRTIFTHDHFGPSTHQQVGLYAGLLTYKGRSPATQWLDATNGTPFGGRFDGGPTSWKAVIRGPEENFREFALEFGDFQHAYWANNDGYPDPKRAINPPGRIQKWNDLVNSPWIYEKPVFVGECPSGGEPPCPEAISADDPGFAVVNYKSEPLALRVTDDPQDNPTLAPAPRGDLSYAFSSLVHGDPDTPLLEAYENDPVHMRILVGAHEEEHNFSIHGTRWLFEPSAVDSGYKSSQMMGISEFYDFEVPHLLGAVSPHHDAVDFLWKAGSSADDLWNGIWGIIRAYKGQEPGVFPVSPGRFGGPDVRDVEEGEAPRPTQGALTAESSGPTAGAGGTAGASAGTGTPFPIPTASICPPESLPPRGYSVVAVAASQALPGNRLVYNSRTTSLDQCDEVENPYPSHDDVDCNPTPIKGPLVDPDAILFVHASDLNPDFTLKATAPIEPLILRARAGECVVVKLHNALPDNGPWAADRDGYSLLPNILDFFNQNQVPPSARVGLHPTLVSYDVLLSDGNNVGFNLEQTVAPGQSRRMVWYMGIAEVDPNGDIVGTPVEFGSVPLYSSDPIKHSNKGAVGALIVEPKGAQWIESPRTRAVAVVDPTPHLDNGDAFREFVLVFQDDINLFASDERHDLPVPLRPIAIAEDPTETGHAAFNYRTEPVWFRQGFLPHTDPGATRMLDLADTFSNALVGGDPETPLFRAARGENLRFRMVHPAGDTQQHTWGVHGHEFLEQPWRDDSTVMGFNPESEYKGVQYGIGPTTGFDAVLTRGAGGAFQIPGDYMYRDYVPWHVSNGLWGILRVYASRLDLEAAEPEWIDAQPAPEPIAEPAAAPATALAPGFDATQPQTSEVFSGE